MKKIFLILIIPLLFLNSCNNKINKNKWTVDIEQYDNWKQFNDKEIVVASNNIRKMSEHKHLEYSSSEYVDILRYKNLNIYDLIIAGNKIKDMVEDNALPTLFVFTWDDCEYCNNFLKQLKGKDFSKHFNLILGQSYTEDFNQFIGIKDGEEVKYNEVPGDVKLEMIEKDKVNVATKYKENNLEEFVKYSMYGTDDLMQAFDAYYYPTLLYLSPNGELMNVSKGLYYEDILKIFKACK